LRNTFTGLKTEHAEAVYKNFYKGDPPFKPQKGNFGKVSWFAGSGNPYVGGQTQSYTVTVDVGVPDVITLLGKKHFDDFLAGYLRKTKADLNDTSTHRAFWEALGGDLEGYSMVEVTVPQCVVSRQGSGTFIAANATGRLSVTLTNAPKLRQDLAALNVDVDALEQAVDNRNTTNAPSFTIEFNCVKPVCMGTSKFAFMTTLKQTAGATWAIEPATLAATSVAAPPPQGANPIIAQAYQGCKKVTVTMTFADFKAARQQAKYWAMLTSNQTIANNYGRMTVTGGANWSATATRAYTEKY
jgi:hypothetical protein